MQGADLVVAEDKRSLPGCGDNGRARSVNRSKVDAGVAGNDVRSDRRRESLMHGLLGDAEGSADLRPGPAVATAAVDEVPEQGVGGLLQLRGGGGGRDQLVQRLLGVSVLADRVDEFLERRRRRHASTLG